MTDLLFNMDWLPELRVESLTPVFRAVTELGSNWFAVLFLTLGLLLGRKSTFARLIVVCAFSEILNVHLKSAYMAPRPDPTYRLVDVTGWSFPSGHAQHGTVMWLWLAWETGKPAVWIGGILLAVAVALSRVYLGAHFVNDVVAAILLGLAMIAYYLWLFDHRHRDTNRYASSLVLSLIGAAQLVWIVLTPVGARVYAFLPGMIYFGFLAGAALGRRSPLTPKPRLVWAVLLTVLVFAIGIFTEFSVGSSWIGPFGLGTHPVSVHVQFALLGVWMGLAAPITFKKIEITA